MPVLRHARGPSTLAVSHLTICCHHIQSGEPGSSEVHFACPEQGYTLNSVKMPALGDPELGEIGPTELFPEDIWSVLVVRIQDDEALTFLLVWNGSHHTGRLTEDLVE